MAGKNVQFANDRAVADASASLGHDLNYIALTGALAVCLNL
jgi:hypothetical protein